MRYERTSGRESLVLTPHDLYVLYGGVVDGALEVEMGRCSHEPGGVLGREPSLVQGLIFRLQEQWEPPRREASGWSFRDATLQVPLTERELRVLHESLSAAIRCVRDWEYGIRTGSEKSEAIAVDNEIVRILEELDAAGAGDVSAGTQMDGVPE